MRVYLPRILAVCLALLISAHALHAAELSGEDRTHARNAFSFAQREKWNNALQHARKAKNPLLLKTVQWMYYKNKDSGAGFEEITTFVRKNSGWPDEKTLRQRAEESLYRRGFSDSQASSWFARYPPVSELGQLAAAEVEERSNRGRTSRDGVADANVIAQVRNAWINGDFDEAVEKQILARRLAFLRPQEHIKRIDHLLWQERVKPAQRVLSRVPEEYRRLFNARIAFIRNERGSVARFNQVSKRLANDPGLIYDRLRWYARRNQEANVRELLIAAPNNVPYPEKWWKLRENAVRDALGEGNPTLALRLLRNHGQTEGQELAEALWLTGWITLEFANQPDEAYKAFYKLYNTVKYPVSKARAAYWAGRSAEKKGFTRIASNWYRQASLHPTTFYGQLGIQALNKGSALRLPAPLTLSTSDKAAFRKKELVRVITLLNEAQQDHLASKFTVYLVDNASTPKDAALIAEFGTSIGHPEDGVKAAKRAMQNNVVLIDSGYPLRPTIASPPIERALMMAITRQESEFDRRARSPSNALGMMQMLPSTAQETARREELPYAQSRLWEADYNMRLGSLYLSKLVKQFNGSYVKAIAAYNAGPGNVRKWESQLGDPGRDPIKTINWIEKIPFGETRNYVQRVMENLQVYRQLLANKTPPNLKLHADLVR